MAVAGISTMIELTFSSYFTVFYFDHFTAAFMIWVLFHCILEWMVIYSCERIVTPGKLHINVFFSGNKDRG